MGIVPDFIDDFGFGKTRGGHLPGRAIKCIFFKPYIFFLAIF